MIRYQSVNVKYKIEPFYMLSRNYVYRSHCNKALGSMMFENISTSTLLTPYTCFLISISLQMSNKNSSYQNEIEVMPIKLNQRC